MPRKSRRSREATGADAGRPLSNDVRRALEQEQKARAALEERAHELTFLAEAGKVLGATLDHREALRALARLCVPRLADWCSISLLGPDGVLESVEVAHEDPGRVALTREYQQRYPSDPDAPQGSYQVVRTRAPELIPAFTDEMLSAAVSDEEQLRLLRKLGLSSAMTVPLIARDQVLGVLTLVSAESGGPFDERDLSFASELATRAALAVDNALLYHAQVEQQQQLEANAVELKELNAELEQTVEELHSQMQETELARETAERARERATRLQAVTQVLAASLTQEDVTGAIVHQCAAALGAHLVVLVVVEAGDRLRLIGSVGLPPEFEAEWRVLPASAATPLSDAVRRREAVFMESPEQLEASYPAIDRVGDVRDGAMAAVPLLAENRTLGALGLSWVEPRHFSIEEREFTLALAGLAAQALERARLYAGERDARAAAEDASHAKSQFLAVMSHELRTPLNAIVGYTDLLEGGIAGALNDKQKEHLGRIHHSAWHLRNMIDEILSLSRIEAGKEEIRVQSFDAAAVAREAAALVEPEAAREGLEFGVEIDGRLPMQSDSGKLHQILLNLLSNAVKFTERGSIRLAARSDDGWVLFDVQDTGPGIATEFHGRIFEPFTQVDQSATRRKGGTGLGLPVSRRLARVLGGDLTVESEVGKGSTFSLRLPTIVPLVD